MQLSKLIETKTVELGRSPTIPELAKAAGAEEEEVLEAAVEPRVHRGVALDGWGKRRGREVDPLESLGAEPEYEISEDRAVLAPGFRVLDERERMILHLQFFKGLTQSQIARSAFRRCMCRASSGGRWKRSRMRSPATRSRRRRSCRRPLGPNVTSRY